MTLTDAIETLKNGYADAAKRPAMGGYIKRSEISTEAGTEGDFTLTLKNRAGTEYEIDYDASASAGSKWTAASGSSFPTLTGELWEEFLGDDWTVGKSEDFEAARNPGQDDLW